LENKAGDRHKETGRSQKEIEIMKKIQIFFSIMFVLVFSAAAQQGTPTVSQIKVEARNNLIRVSWTDSPEARGPVYIFRSARPFSGSIPANIRPVPVRYGQQYYVDDTEDMTNLYYFIAASDVSGRRYDTIIPQTNSTYINLAQPQLPQDAPPSVTAAAESAEADGNLFARQEGERVIITYENIDPYKNAILYRSTQPFRQTQALLNATVVQSPVTFPFTDYPVPGFLWYYAVIFEDEIVSGNIGIKPGVNATVSPVLISGDEAAQRAMRAIPLPMLTLRDHHDGFLLTDLPQQAYLNTGRDRQSRQKPPLELKKPRVYVIDLEATTGGEDSALVQIVQEYIEKYDWEGARTALRHYLSLPRSKDVEARARFYMGQAFYYTAQYREALFEFLTFRSYNSAEANTWIEAVLTAMVY
jgi:hypothetical protein